MSKFLAFSRVVVVVGVTVITFMCGVHFEKKVLAPKARAAAIAKFKAANAGRMKMMKRPIGPAKPCKPCVEEKKKADAAKVKPASSNGERKIIRIAQILNPPPVGCSLTCPAWGGYEAGEVVVDVTDENDQFAVGFAANCGGGNFACVGAMQYTISYVSEDGTWVTYYTECIPIDIACGNWWWQFPLDLTNLADNQMELGDPTIFRMDASVFNAACNNIGVGDTAIAAGTQCFYVGLLSDGTPTVQMGSCY